VPDYPEDLDRALSRGDASLLGIGWRELDGPLWRRPYRGVHVWAATDAASPRQRALDAASLLPEGGALGGWAACAVAIDGELDGFGPGFVPEPVMLCLAREQRVRRGPGIRPLRSPLDPGDVVEIAGVPVTRPLRTAFDIARTSDLEQGVVAIDYLGRGRPAFAVDLADYARERSSMRGAGRVIAAARQASPRARSEGETRVRLLWTRAARLPCPEVNAVVRLDDGFYVGMSDLLDPRAATCVEYDGAGHREERRHTVDNVREEGFERCGLVVVRVTAMDLVPRARVRTCRRLLSGRDEGSRRPRGGWTWEEGPLPPPTPHW
jgi:very-short-patch-repair endonuclease